MNLNNPRNMIIAAIALFAVVLAVFMIYSGSGRRGALDSSHLIPEQKLVSILSDIYLTDGLLSYPKVKGWFPDADSTSTYYHIVQKYGYTWQAFDKTMKYYFIRKPKKLIKIYDQLLGRLSALESKAEKATMAEQQKNENLWTGAESFGYPDFSGKDPASFDIKLIRTGEYVLSFIATVYPDDCSDRPELLMYTNDFNNTGSSEKKWIKTPRYIKDGLPHTYYIKIELSGNTGIHLAGSLYSYRSNPQAWEKHISFRMVSLRVRYSA
jgi:Domain of unknown function (DUF4296)